MARVLPRLSLGLVILVLLSTPAGAANKEHQQMMADVRMLQEQVQRQQLQIAALTETLKTVTTQLEAQANTQRKAMADQKLVIDGMARDLGVVRQKADDNNVSLGKVALDIEAISKGLAQGGAPAGGNPPPSGAGEQPGATPSQLFATAQSDFMVGNYDLAVSGFTGYLNNWPKGAQAPDAQTYIGDAYRKQGKFDLAVEAYTKVVTNFPSSAKVAEALCKRGNAYEDAGDKVHARESYQAVIDKYPADNSYTIQAVQRLAAMKDPSASDRSPSSRYR